MKHSFVDRYADLDSPLHSLESRTKILGFAVLIAAVLCVPGGKGLAFLSYFFLTAVLLGISQIPLTYVVGRSMLIFPFILLAGIALPWKEQGGLAAFGILFMRSILSLMLLILLTNTTRFSELLRGLHKLGCPAILVLNLAFLYRYLFVLIEEAMRMRMARDCRRVGRASIRAEVRLLGSMLGTLLLRSFDRAERMYQAMLSRGYAGDFPILEPKHFSWRDLAFLSALALFITLSFADIPISGLML